MAQCRQCKELMVEEMSSGEMVCVACGLVHDDFVIGQSHTVEGMFCSDKTGVHIMEGQAVGKCIRQNLYRHKTFSQRLCLRILRRIGADCKLSATTCREVESMYAKIYSKYKHKRLSFKVLLAAVCIYDTMQNLNCPISLLDYCGQLGCNVKEFISIRSKIKTYLDVNEKDFYLKEDVRSVLKHFPQQTFEERKKFSAFVEKTVEVMTFARRCWLVTGRSFNACIIGSAYLAWRSLHTSRRWSFKEFWKLCGFCGSQRTSRDRGTELMDVFIKLGNQLPFLKYTTITKKNVIHYLDDIIQYRGHITDSLFPENGDNQELQKYNGFRRKMYGTSSSSQDADDVLEADPVLMSDEEVIPDSDWKLYLKSDVEVALVKGLMEKVGY